jgi:hypothetical protein
MRAEGKSILVPEGKLYIQSTLTFTLIKKNHDILEITCNINILCLVFISFLHAMLLQEYAVAASSCKTTHFVVLEHLLSILIN